ncbi:TetR/AcrR family transcriptional regulator [Pseudomonas sp. NCHU5208]|uniref:TetR/AcrR family transcriptional regulator n=1 Tax=unclassified Pseudomonas TaxID=196821 RepID=UPI003F957EBE
MTLSSPSSRPARPRGRPREFDLHSVLDQAVRVFSERGYHGTSISDLAHATGLAQGSLYKAFKDKQAIFLAAFEHYRAQRSEQLRQAMGEQGTGLERLRRVLVFYADSAQGAQGRQGCLVVGSIAELSTFPAPVARHIQRALKRNETLLADLLRQGQEDGSVASHVDIEASARTLLCLAQGMRLVGKAGRTRAAMHSVVDAALTMLR